METTRKRAEQLVEKLMLNPYVKEALIEEIEDALIVQDKLTRHAIAHDVSQNDEIENQEKSL